MSQVMIDGQEIAAAARTTVLEAALAAGIYIPHLCHHPDLKPVGVCRLCMVETGGAGHGASCLAPAEEGMVVRTESPEIDKVAADRRRVAHDQPSRRCLSCARTTAASCSVPPHTWESIAGGCALPPPNAAQRR